MAYTNLTNLKKFMPSVTIEQLTDDNGVGEIQTEIIDDAISTAQQLIDGFMKGRYPDDIDDDDVPELITDIATKLTAFNLYRRTLATTLPEPIKMEYQTCMKQLKAIQEGKLSPFPAISEPEIFVSNKDSDSRIFNEALWDKY